jgi:hypothetical protein
MNMKAIAQNTAKHAKRHKYKYIFGAPIMFALFVNIDALNNAVNTLSLTTDQSKFVEVGESVTVTTKVYTTETINAIGASIEFNPNMLAVTSLDPDSTVVDLWAEKPRLSSTPGNVIFAGGVTSGDFMGSGEVFSFNVKAIDTGTAKLSLVDPEILANDGVGTNLISRKYDLTLYVRDKGLASPDLNDDGRISLMDVNILYFNTLRSYDPTYDLNGDGDVSLADVRALLKML